MESEKNLFRRLLCGSTDGEEVSKVPLHVSVPTEADERQMRGMKGWPLLVIITKTLSRRSAAQCIKENVLYT